ncbi:SRPBCC family protein [Actinokineospora sp. NBRC 105648]|uniref:SRPBCC family protein n=1 Tax=Actinokineospora sp. NBRC 105648 TaxID=3032206 RepID=UPI0024A1055F|nr:SRPBCC family protein [Actinokineospora sp. NBRC 105648]GLZ37219.1 hypothetical protein Acsp05_08440 [Actinokineospora sp. NBRC 105648]
MDATLHTDAGRHVLRFERALRHPPEKVWRAITEPEHLDHWFPAALHDKRGVGERITFRFPDGTDGGTGTITDLDPPRRFAFTWQGETLRFDLRPTDTGCLLVFTHHFDDHAGAASFAAGWQICLGALDDLLDGTPPTDHDWVAAHEHYVDRFDLLRGTTHPDGDTWRVQFERQLPTPADDVRPHLPTLIGAEPTAETDTRYDADLGTGQTVRVELRPGPGGARLTLTHRGLTDTDLDAAHTCWRTAIQTLATTLTGHPHQTEHPVAHHPMT